MCCSFSRRLKILPSELNGVADEVHVHFPWGSLLRAVATGEIAVLRNLRRICAPGALLEVVIGLDPERDQSEIERLGLTPLSIEFIDRQFSLQITRRRDSRSPNEESSPPPNGLNSIPHGQNACKETSSRPITYLIARAI